MKSVFAVSFVLLLICMTAPAQTRTLRVDDLFNLRRVGATVWAPDGRFVAIEFSRPSRWLEGVPANDLSLLDVKTQTLRSLSTKSVAYVGFFNAIWSPDSQRVAFLSIDRNAVVRAWVWTVGTATASLVPNIEPRIGLNDPPLAWVDGDRLAVMSWEPGAVRSGPLHVRVLRGRNVATRWQQAIDGKTASVLVQESPAVLDADAPNVELVAVDLSTGARKRLARGRIHSLSVASDGCCVSFMRHTQMPVAAYIEKADRAGDVEAGYSAVNWGTERHVIDARSGVEVEQTRSINKPSESQPRPKLPAPPQPDARLLSMSPRNDAAIYVANGSSGSQMWLSGGAGRPLTSYSSIWHANEWMKDVKLGRAERLSYKAADGSALNAWLLLPPDYAAGTRVPVVTIVYPGSVYGLNEPSSFSPYRVNFEHPQLFAALGYAVLLASMPETKVSSDSHALAPLLNGVIPALDAAIAHGAADPDRIAGLGQSDGGFAVLGLITQTNRFRSAIASAGFSDFNSLYGTFYGQYRHGDSGRPETAQMLRMLQMEKGAMGMGGPPWQVPDLYRENSAINRADKVETPLLLIHGEVDFVPIQQAEEFFTALFRQDKRVTLLRYAGEGHTISDRANVLDMWQRVEKFLGETMAPRAATQKKLAEVCHGKSLPITMLPGPEMTGPRLPLRFGGTRQFQGAPINSFVSDKGFRLVIKSREEFADFWKRFTAPIPPSNGIPPPPEIDFTKEMIVVSAMGMRPTSGYWTVIDGACEVDGHVEVFVSSVEDVRCTGVLTSITYPADAVRIPRSDLPVVFRETQISCTQWLKLIGYK